MANRVEYLRGPLIEWYANGPLGLEQGFTLKTRPAVLGAEPLTLALDLSGDLSASLGPQRNALRLIGGGTSLRYTGLAANDARGQELRAWLELRGRQVLLRVADAGARYPLTVDPVVEQAKLTASDGAVSDFLGWSVAVSGDTIVTGAYGDDVGGNQGQGSIYVFVEPAGGWADGTETAKLTASDGAASDQLGRWVAVSGDTIVAGAAEADGGRGAAYVFVKPASGWADGTETAKLTASDGAAFDLLGVSVAVSGDTVVAGAYGDDVGGNHEQGTAYVFVEPAGGWASATETAKLTASDGVAFDGLGVSVAVSGDTVVAGAYADDIGSNEEQGSAYVFVEPTGGWADGTETAKLTASDGAFSDWLGISVGMSGDTVVAGAYGDDVGSNVNQGSAYVFVKPVAGWASGTQTAKLTASDGAEVDYLGVSVAVSGDTVVAGLSTSFPAKGSAYKFVKPAAGWASGTETAKLIASDGAAGDLLGRSVAVLGDTIVAGAPLTDVGIAPDPASNQGSAYVFGPNPRFSCTGVSAAPTTIQPATRDQMKLIALQGATDPDGDPLTFHIDAVTQDESVSGQGDDTFPDAALTEAGADSNQVLVRAERNPTGNGRVYRIAFTLSDGQGESCSGTAGIGGTTNAKVSVPRKKGQTAVDDGDSGSWDSFTGVPAAGTLP
jgi:hypothetical protein